MAVKPIIFSGAMVRALLDGRKTQTRRVLKPRKHASLIAGGWTDDYVLSPGNAEWLAQEVPYAPGDLLWVRESWRVNGWASDVASIFYKAHERASYTEMCEQFPIAGKAYIAPTPGKWKPSIHMPRWASRLTLEVTDVRVQRVQEISEADAAAEGTPCLRCGKNLVTHCRCAMSSADHRDDFRALWDPLNAGRGYSWESNPWVCALTFRCIPKNIDEVIRDAA